MVLLPKAIIPTDHAEAQISSFEPIEKGIYKAMITFSELKATKARTGHYLELTFEIVDGEHKGRCIWHRLNLDNPNATAVEIAERDMASIGRACNLQSVTDSTQLHSVPMDIKVAIDSGSADYKPSNKIVGFVGLGGDALAFKVSPITSDDMPF